MLLCIIIFLFLFSRDQHTKQKKKIMLHAKKNLLATVYDCRTVKFLYKYTLGSCAFESISGAL